MKLRFLASHSTLSSPLLRFGLVRKDAMNVNYEYTEIAFASGINRRARHAEMGVACSDRGTLEELLVQLYALLH